MIFRLAWRNIWRNKRRTMITVGSVALGVWLAASFVGMAHNQYRQMINTSARLGLGHVTVQAKGYLDTPTLQKRLSNATQVAKQAMTRPEVRRTTTRIMGQAMFATASRSVGGAFYAVDPANEDRDVSVFAGNLVEGKMFEPNSTRGIVIGDEMARRLGVKLGKKVVVTAVDVDGEIVGEMMRVTGMFDTGVDLVDGTTALMPIGAVRRMLGYGEHEASVVSVYLDQHKAADRVAASLRGTVDLETMEVFTWESTQSEIAGMISIDAAMNYMFQLLLGVLVAAGILNTMLMSVLERRREMGIMMAVGMTRGRLFRLVLLESSLVATLGSAVGFLATVPWYAYMSTTGIDLTEYLGDDMNMSGIAIEPVLRLWLDGPTIAAILGGAFALTLAASLYPAFRAGRDAPVESIRSI